MKKYQKTAPAMIGRLSNGRVHWEGDETRAALWLADRGMSYNTIAQRTGLSKGQIRYRLVQKNIHVSDYRNGRGAQGIRIIMNCQFLHLKKKNVKTG